MKKINVLFLLLFALGISFISCTKDFEDGGNYNGSNKGIGGNDDGLGDDPIQNTGDYWPTAIGNQWILDQNGAETSIKIIAREGDYFKFDQFFGMGEGIEAVGSVCLKKVKGDYLLKVADLAINYGEGISGKISGYEFIFFKDYLDINQTWKGNFTQTTSFNISGFPPVTTNVSYTGTILEKASSVTVDNITYNDVIKFKFHQEARILGELATSSDAEYWMAKDVGVVKFITSDFVSSLKTYVVKK